MLTRLLRRLKRPHSRRCPATFRPAVVQLDARIVPTYYLWHPTVAGNLWNDMNNWDANGANGNHTGTPSNNTDIAAFNTYNNPCYGANATIGSLTVGSNYTSTIQLNGPLTCGTASMSSALGGGSGFTIDCNGNAFTLQGASDEWTTCAIKDASAGGGGSLVCGATGRASEVTANFSSQQLCSVEILVPQSLVFTGSAGVNLNGSGYFDVSGVVTVDPSTPQNVVFGRSNVSSFVRGIGNFNFTDPTFTITCPIFLSAEDGSFVNVNPGTVADLNGVNGVNISTITLLAGTTTVPTVLYAPVILQNNSVLLARGFDDTNTLAKVKGDVSLADNSEVMLGNNDTWTGGTTTPKLEVTGDFSTFINATATVWVKVEMGGLSMTTAQLLIDGDASIGAGTKFYAQFDGAKADYQTGL